MYAELKQSRHVQYNVVELAVVGVSCFLSPKGQGEGRIFGTLRE